MMVKSLILLSFHAFLRPGEAVDSVNSLQLADIQTGSNSLKIKFRKFKHCKGIPVTVKVKKQGNKYCPVTAMLKYLFVRGFKQGNLFCLANGTPVSYIWYNEHFKQIVKCCNMQDLVKPHSLRIGAATHAATLGIADDVIRRMGRWSSSSYKLYIKLPILTIF